MKPDNSPDWFRQVAEKGGDGQVRGNLYMAADEIERLQRKVSQLENVISNTVEEFRGLGDESLARRFEGVLNKIRES